VKAGNFETRRQWTFKQHLKSTRRLGESFHDCMPGKVSSISDLSFGVGAQSAVFCERKLPPLSHTNVASKYRLPAQLTSQPEPKATDHTLGSGKQITASHRRSEPQATAPLTRAEASGTQLNPHSGGRMAAVSSRGGKGPGARGGACLPLQRQHNDQAAARIRSLTTSSHPSPPHSTGSTGQPKAVLERADGQAGRGQAQVGNGVQRCASLLQAAALARHRLPHAKRPAAASAHCTAGLKAAGAGRRDTAALRRARHKAAAAPRRDEMWFAHQGSLVPLLIPTPPPLPSPQATSCPWTAI
jgi:hypothetical protein